MGLSMEFIYRKRKEGERNNSGIDIKNHLNIMASSKTKGGERASHQGKIEVGEFIGISQMVS